MCGITGFIDYSENSSETILDQMVSTLRHRGPDNSGRKLYKNEHALIGFGQTRLSIIDLSSGANQPMEFENLSIIYNGEIYNYRAIKETLAQMGHQFNTTSDTEMILHAFHEWGVGCVERFVGMFAFVLYDKENEKIYAFRDRAGIKPFYFFHTGSLFLFGSELKALMKHPLFEKRINVDALKSFFNFGYVPTPYCIFENTHKLEPGSYLEFDIANNSLEHHLYWNPVDFFKKEKLKLEYEEAKEELHTLLKSAFQYRMISDVPVGVFLSGGYDSTAVAAILQSEAGVNLKTFTIGFEEGNNEAPYAKNTAEFLGTNHHEYTCTTLEAQQIIPAIPYYYDEPFADSSAIPTMLVSRFAREHVKVALSADAGDELFAGYDTYPALISKLKWMNRIPDIFKHPSAALFSGISSIVPTSHPALKHKTDGLSKALNRDKFQQAADLFRVTNSLPEMYLENLFSSEVKDFKTKFDLNPSGFQDEAEIALLVDYQSYLQNDILTKVDRATMSVSLEGRDPFVDHRLFEFVARLPYEYKFDGVSTKRILKDIVHEYLPREMMDRPKSGFSLPIYSWLRGDLSFLIDTYLSEDKLAVSGLFNISFLLEQVDMFKQNKLHYSPLIWKVLIFQMWYEEWIG